MGGVPPAVWNWLGWGLGYLALVGLIVAWNHWRCRKQRHYWRDHGPWPR